MVVALSILLALTCLIPGAGKLAAHPRMRRSADHFGIAWPRYRLIGVAEVVAAGGVMIGLLWRPAGLMAAGGMTLLLVGALIAHRRAHDNARDAFPAVLALVVSTAYLAAAQS
jgi:uncharacterized membrane protein YphA (DoxX/SURF4 family)